MTALRALDALGPHVVTVTTSYVMLECANAAARRPYRALVDQARRRFELGKKLIVPTEADWDQAWLAYIRAGSSGAGVVDQTSFLIMRRLKITDAFTNDKHFKTAGFNTLL